MSNNTEHRALWTMSSKPLPAPVALTARQVDFPYHSTRQKVRIIRLHDFADEFMAPAFRRSRSNRVEAQGRCCRSRPRSNRITAKPSGRCGRRALRTSTRLLSKCTVIIQRILRYNWPRSRSRHNKDPQRTRYAKAIWFLYMLLFCVQAWAGEVVLKNGGPAHRQIIRMDKTSLELEPISWVKLRFPRMSSSRSTRSTALCFSWR